MIINGRNYRAEMKKRELDKLTPAERKERRIKREKEEYQQRIKNWGLETEDNWGEPCTPDVIYL